jgi:putative transposase
MKYNSDKHHRRSIRLKEYDYSQVGGYFVTICTYRDKCLLGSVISGEMRLSKCGEIVNKFWHRIASHFTDVKTDVFVVIPNHIHGIIFITDERRCGVSPPHPPIRARRPRPYKSWH